MKKEMSEKEGKEKKSKLETKGKIIGRKKEEDISIHPKNRRMDGAG